MTERSNPKSSYSQSEESGSDDGVRIQSHSVQLQGRSSSTMDKKPFSLKNVASIQQLRQRQPEQQQQQYQSLYKQSDADRKQSKLVEARHKLQFQQFQETIREQKEEISRLKQCIKSMLNTDTSKDNLLIRDQFEEQKLLNTANSLESLGHASMTMSATSSIKNLLNGGGDTFVTGMKDVMAIVREEMERLRQKLMRRDHQNTRLKEQVEGLKQRIVMYRQMTEKDVAVLEPSRVDHHISAGGQIPDLGALRARTTSLDKQSMNEAATAIQEQYTEDFAEFTSSVSYIPRADTLSELFEAIERSCKRIFQTEKVSFLFQDMTIIDILTKEGCRFLKQEYQLQTFHIFIPNNVRSKDYVFDFRFSNFHNAVENKVCKEKYMVSPIIDKLIEGNEEKLIALVQMEQGRDSTYSFSMIRDQKAFRIIQRMISSVLRRIFYKRRCIAYEKRAFVILDHFIDLVASRKHFEFCLKFQAQFHNLFNYECSSLLFINPTTGQLFSFLGTETPKIKRQTLKKKITLDEDEMLQKMKDELQDQVKGLEFVLPQDQGVTRTVLQSRQTRVVVDNAFKDRDFSIEVDNPFRLTQIRDLMFGPCIDRKGNIRGVCQLYNKNGIAPGNQTDVKEFNRLLPVLGEMIAQLDSHKRDNEIVYCVGERLKDNTKDILESMEQDMETSIASKALLKMTRVKDRVDAMVNNKKAGLKDREAALWVLRMLRQRSKEDQTSLKVNSGEQSDANDSNTDELLGYHGII